MFGSLILNHAVREFVLLGQLKLRSFMKQFMQNQYKT